MLIEFQNPLNASPMVFPVLECFHILGFIVAVGTIAVVDFSLLGLGVRSQKPTELTKDLAPWTMAGLTSVLLSGPLMFSSDPDMYYLNHSFQIKMVLLVLALAFHFTYRRKALRAEISPAAIKAAACLSLLLWVSIIFGGLFIAFV